MRQVTPDVYLIAQPTVDFDEVHRYLLDVGVDDPEGVIDNTPESDGEALVMIGGKLCYRSWEPGLNANVTKIREDQKEYLGNILKSGHGSVLEHANYSFILHNVSRVLTHELVRHRAGMAFSQESLRFVRLTDLPFWFPAWALADEELMSRSVDLLLRMEQHQKWMAEHFGLDDEGVPFHEKKHKTSFMRRFAPEGVATGILATINVRALRHIIFMRTALGAEEEIRLVMDKVAEKALDAIPNLMQDYSPNDHREWIPEFLKV
jgi:thymidylate synthase (FAD)